MFRVKFSRNQMGHRLFVYFFIVFFKGIFLYMPFGMRPKGPSTTAYASREAGCYRCLLSTFFRGCLRVEHQVDAERG